MAISRYSDVQLGKYVNIHESQFLLVELSALFFISRKLLNGNNGYHIIFVTLPAAKYVRIIIIRIIDDFISRYIDLFQVCK